MRGNLSLLLFRVRLNSLVDYFSNMTASIDALSPALLTDFYKLGLIISFFSRVVPIMILSASIVIGKAAAD